MAKHITGLFKQEQRQNQSEHEVDEKLYVYPSGKGMQSQAGHEAKTADKQKKRGQAMQNHKPLFLLWAPVFVPKQQSPYGQKHAKGTKNMYPFIGFITHVFQDISAGRENQAPFLFDLPFFVI